MILYRAFFEPGVSGWPEHACIGCSMVADQVAHPAHLNARDTSLAFVSRASQPDIKRVKARMSWEHIPWYKTEEVLAEWVRKGVKAMESPLPGTSTKISCVISILQAGGGCGLTDPNMQDQPAVARPPPDIPFKKHLQEDNGSVRPPPGG